MKRIVPLVLIIAIAASAAWYLWPAATDPDRVQGYIEGDLVLVGPESAGRIVSLAVDSGSNVTENAELFGLDTRSEEAARDEAQAKLNQTKAQLADLQAAVQRPEQVAVLKATENRAKAALDLSRADVDRQRALFQKGFSSEARLQQAQAQFQNDEAALAEARRQIEAAEIPGRSELITGAEAAVKAADATLDGAVKALEKRRVFAPVAAVVEDVYFRAGEVVAAGQPVLALLPPGNRKVRFYVPEPQLSGLKLGQDVTIYCDGCQPMTARLTFLSSEAEFTPPVIFSEEERAKLVFKAEAKLTEGETLPLGLPVDVLLHGPAK